MFKEATKKNVLWNKTIGGGGSLTAYTVCQASQTAPLNISAKYHLCLTKMRGLSNCSVIFSNFIF